MTRSALAPLRYAVRAATPALALGTAALTAVLAACSDSATGPRSAPVASRAPAPTPPPALLAAMSRPFSESTTPNGVVMHGDTTVATVTFDPKIDNQFALGRQGGVQLAAHSVCDPATSGYGPALWDRPCVAATSPITLTVKVWRATDGRAVVTFAPDLRFVPALTNWLWVSASGVPAHQDGTIGWCPTGGSCVDESRADWSLGTGTSQGRLFRRIKHFSGYTVLVG